MGKASVLARADRREQALAVLKRARAWSPTHADAVDLQARLMAAGGDVDEALATVAEAIREDPRSLRLRTSQADLLARAGRAEEAERLLEDTLRMDPAFMPAATTLAQLKLLRDDASGAVEVFERAAARASDSREVQTQLGLLLLETGDRARAIEVFDRVLADSKADDSTTSVPVLAHLGMALACMQSDPERAVEAYLGFLRSARVAGESPLRMLSAVPAEQLDDLLLLSSRAVERAPADLVVGQTHAVLAMQSGDHESALREIERLLQEENRTDDERLRLMVLGAQAADLAGEPGKATSWIRRALDVDPGQVVLLDMLVRHELASGVADPAVVEELSERSRRARGSLSSRAALDRLDEIDDRLRRARGD